MGSVIDAAAFEAIHSDSNLPPLLRSLSPCIAPAVNPVGRAEDGESSVHHLNWTMTWKWRQSAQCVYTEYRERNRGDSSSWNCHATMPIPQRGFRGGINHHQSLSRQWRYEVFIHVAPRQSWPRKMYRDESHSPAYPSTAHPNYSSLPQHRS